MAESFQTVIGLMSGTSADGIDAALIETDGETTRPLRQALMLPYDAIFRERLRALRESSPDLPGVERELTRLHVVAVKSLLEQAGRNAEDIHAIGFHGHTVFHHPAKGKTLQIGNGAILARECKIVVVNDFRTSDILAGGQGAPLVPVYHRALAKNLEKPLAVLNLGGVGNVTWIGDHDHLLAFDTGPGNALLDDWALTHLGQPLDKDGALASSGAVQSEAVEAFMRHPYFVRRPPKSLDRDDFAALAATLTQDMSAADGAATLAAFTIVSVKAALDHFPDRPKRWLVTGGGRKNPALMNGLAQCLDVPVDPVEAVGWDGDALEAEAFAFLAARSLLGRPTSYPETTGVRYPIVGGQRSNFT